jgi:hypothetical protein
MHTQWHDNQEKTTNEKEKKKEHVPSVYPHCVVTSPSKIQAGIKKIQNEKNFFFEINWLINKRTWTKDQSEIWNVKRTKIDIRETWKRGKRNIIDNVLVIFKVCVEDNIMKGLKIIERRDIYIKKLPMK